MQLHANAALSLNQRRRMTRVFLSVVNAGEQLEYIEHVFLRATGPDLDTGILEMWTVAPKEPEPDEAWPRPLPACSSASFRTCRTPRRRPAHARRLRRHRRALPPASASPATPGTPTPGW